MKIFVFVAALAIPSAASAQPAPSAPTGEQSENPGDPPARAKAAKLTKAELQVVAHVHHVNVMEISMGKLAQRKGTAAVKRYGESLQLDHETADKALVAFAKQRGVARIPADKPATEVERQAHKLQMKAMAALKKLEAADFDREFLRQMVDGHEQELAKSDVAIASATDAELKTMLETRKGMLQRHADTARELQKGNAQASAGPGPAGPGPKSAK